MNLKINFYCVDLHTDKILLVCPLADWARLKHVNGISFKENLELFTTPPCLDSGCEEKLGGGGALMYRGGAYTRYQNSKIPLKHLFLAKKAHLF